MVAAGAETLITSQPLPKSRLDVVRAANGSLAGPQQLERYLADMHAQGGVFNQS